METIGFVGAGNMAEALIRGVTLGHVYRPECIYISDVRPERLSQMQEKYGVVPVQSNSELAKKSDVVVLSVKPQNTREALESIKDSLQEDALIISIIAGKRIADIAAILGDVAIVRVMPNTPALIDEGASALFANAMATSKRERARLIFLCVGKSIMLDREDLIDAVTAVSGSGPAYYFLMLNHMIQAGIELGLPEDYAKALVLQTAKGAALLAEQADREGESPTDLARKVATPGGTTEAAFNVFEQRQFADMVSQALKAAADRSRELSQG